MNDLLKFDAGTNPWKEVIIEACIVGHLSWDENDPRKTLANLIGWETTIALDPKVSSEAQALIDRGRSEALAHREGEQDAGTRMYEPHTRVLELYYAQKDGCKTHPIGCGKICLECVADELIERESAWQKEREALSQLSLQIRNLARLAWTDQKNAEYLFREIGKRAQEIGKSCAAPQPIPEGYEKKCIKCGWGLSPNQIRCESCLTYVDKPEAQPIPEGGKK